MTPQADSIIRPIRKNTIFHQNGLDVGGVWRWAAGCALKIVKKVELNAAPKLSKRTFSVRIGRDTAILRVKASRVKFEAGLAAKTPVSWWGGQEECVCGFAPCVIP